MAKVALPKVINQKLNDKGKLHCENGPSREFDNGVKEWHLNGILQKRRLLNRTIEYYKFNEAIGAFGELQLHREDGPAVAFASGVRHFYLNGERIRKADFLKKLEASGKAVSIGFMGDVFYFKDATKELLHREDGPAIIHVNGDKFWYVNGQQHRVDGPAVEKTYGDKYWYRKGLLHREDGPAVESPDGHKEWWVDGKRHRLDGPAIERVNGSQEWWIEGNKYTYTAFEQKVIQLTAAKRISERKKAETKEPNQIAMEQCKTELVNPIVTDAGSSTWYDDPNSYARKYHRTDGPAVVRANGDKIWYQNNLLHRTDGPAIERANGSKEWWVNGKHNRLDGPAIESPLGYKEWWIDDIPYSAKGFEKKLAEMNKEKPDFKEKSYTNSNTDVKKEAKYLLSNPVIHESEKIWYDDPNKNNRKVHRLDGPAIERANGDKLWYQNGRFHREDGPAVEMANGHKEWFRNGQRHRADGPAIVYANGEESYYLDGVKCSKERFQNKSFEAMLKQDAQEELRKISNNNQPTTSTMKKETTKVNQTVTTPSLADMLKTNAEKAAYVAAANSVTKGVKALLLKTVEDKHGSEAVNVFASVLDSQVGDAGISLLLGLALHYAPTLNEDPRVQKLSENFQVQGMAAGMNMVIGTLMSNLLPIVSNAISTLPPAEAALPSGKVRVADATDQELPEAETVPSQKTQAL